MRGERGGTPGRPIRRTAAPVPPRPPAEHPGSSPPTPVQHPRSSIPGPARVPSRVPVPSRTRHCPSRPGTAAAPAPWGEGGAGGSCAQISPPDPQPPRCCRDLGIRPREIPGHRGCGGFNPFPAAPQCPQCPGGLPPRVGTSVMCPAPPGAVPPPGLRKRGHWGCRDHGEGLGSLPRSPSLPQRRVPSLTVPSVPSSVPQCRSLNCRTQMRFSVSPQGSVGCGATHGCCPCTSHPPSVLSGLQR